MMQAATDVARLEQDLGQRQAELAIINAIQQGLAAHLDVQAIYDLVGDKICEIFRAQIVMISTYDASTDTMEHRYAIERGERIYAPGRHPVRGFRTQIVETRQPVLANTDVAARAVRLGQPTLPGTITPKSWLGVPMIVGGQVTGILSLQDLDREDAYDESHVRFLQTIAASMSLALENARLFEETERLLKRSEQRTGELEIINSVQQGLASRLDVTAIYELVGEKFRATFPHADLSLLVYDPETDLLSAPYLVEHGQRLDFEPRPVGGKGFIGHLIRDPRPLLINERMDEAVRSRQGILASGTGLPKSALYVPVMVGQSMSGAIVLEDMQNEHAFSDSDVRLLESLANAMSVALENARLWERESLYRQALEREFEIGREIQASFLPATVPQPAGWEITASLRSARKVGGDFYDVFELPGGELGIVIADVCDKGLGAALFMTLFRSLVRAVASTDFFVNYDGPAGASAARRVKSAISLTNDYIAQTHGHTGTFATVFFGILNTHTGQLTYINGGHVAPLVVGEHGLKDTLHRTGPALGLIAGANYIVGEVALAIGDIVYAYTDGLTDSTNAAGQRLDALDLVPLLAGDQPLPKLLARIEKKVEPYTMGVYQSDDIAMLAVRRNQIGPVQRRTRPAPGGWRDALGRAV
jgi:serine phosphatase RsbU (regulator of sigma subunit)